MSKTYTKNNYASCWLFTRITGNSLSVSRLCFYLCQPKPLFTAQIVRFIDFLLNLLQRHRSKAEHSIARRCVTVDVFRRSDIKIIRRRVFGKKNYFDWRYSPNRASAAPVLIFLDFTQLDIHRASRTPLDE
jgi:hypothetical protein